MSKVAIITDSTAYLPKEVIDQYNIHVVHQVIIWGGETYIDGIDIQPVEFYKRLENAKIMPTTSQVSVGECERTFSELIDQGYDVLAILLSDRLSGTISSATQALDVMHNGRVEIVNSRTTAMAMGFLVLAAARAAEEGADLAACKRIAEETKDKVGVVFAVDTLEFLHRGGRIGGGARFMGTALKLKPILEVIEGQVDAVERVRTKKKAHKRLVELLTERTDGQTPVRIAVLHANAAEDAHKLLADASAVVHPVETFFSEVSPAVGTHTGPGTVGLAYMIG